MRKRIYIRSVNDYNKLIDCIRKNKILVSESAKRQLLLFPERFEFALLVLYDKDENRMRIGEYDIAGKIFGSEFADSVDDLILEAVTNSKA